MSFVSYGSLNELIPNSQALFGQAESLVRLQCDKGKTEGTVPLTFVLCIVLEEKLSIPGTQFEKHINKHGSVYIAACVPQAQQTYPVHFRPHKTFAEPIVMF